MSEARDFVTPALVDANQVFEGLTPAQWEILVRQARHANLLAHLSVQFDRAGLLAQVPEQARLHFEAAQLWSEAQHRAVRFEGREISRALTGLSCPLVLLKGAAYVLAELPAADGRLFSDIDLLVPRPLIESAETLLLMSGWQGGDEDPYDQRYYRQWMHEIPPMVHSARSTVIDLHHNILPLTCRFKIDANKLLAQVVPLSERASLYRLSDVDLVLHSACHLFLDGEFDKGLRDLVDLNSLLRHFGAEAAFWPQLYARSRELQIELVLFYSLRYVGRVLKTPIPTGWDQNFVAVKPGRIKLSLMDRVFIRALRPDHPSCADWWTGPARLFLYLRAHWMRMPLRLLLPHLWQKGMRRFKRQPKLDDAQAHAPH